VEEEGTATWDRSIESNQRNPVSNPCHDHGVQSLRPKEAHGVRKRTYIITTSYLISLTHRGRGLEGRGRGRSSRQQQRQQPAPSPPAAVPAALTVQLSKHKPGVRFQLRRSNEWHALQGFRVLSDSPGVPLLHRSSFPLAPLVVG
jgi:hypothetical protein